MTQEELIEMMTKNKKNQVPFFKTLFFAGLYFAALYYPENLLLVVGMSAVVFFYAVLLVGVFIFRGELRAGVYAIISTYMSDQATKTETNQIFWLISRRTEFWVFEFFNAIILGIAMYQIYNMIGGVGGFLIYGAFIAVIYKLNGFAVEAANYYMNKQ